MRKKTIKDIDVKGKVCLMRVDFNVKLDSTWNILDDERIRASLSTIYNLIWRWAKIALISHLGRPEEKWPATSLQIVVDRLKLYIQQDHFCLADLDDEAATRWCVDALDNGEVMMFENIRWYDGEKNDIDGFWKYLASFGDIFVNDGFGVSHREDASVIWIAKYLPSVAGLLLADEIKYMELTVNRRQARPFVAVIWGKKAEEKIWVTNALLKKVDDILLWGWIVNTFMKARGCEVGTSFYEPNMVDEVKEIMWWAMDKPCWLVLPKDFVVADKISPDANISIVDYDKIPKNKMALDIWPKTREKYQKILKQAWFILWIWPMGVYEVNQFRDWNDAIMNAIAESDASSFVWWGDTIASVAKHPKKEYISHVSTWGWATLKFLEFGTLPGIEVLDSKE